MNSNLQPISDLTLTHRKVSPRLFADAIGLMAVTIFALAIRLHGSTVPAVWYDEAFSLLLA
ncbi:MULTISPECIES: hypothetical protein [unclassified Pseudomonas]|uniref:hypothetical protein n=1 Tax=unclassified Pseudomonas TaxID=196821 RepID=UPI001EF0FDA3|nr:MULTISPECIES: hypothetical protein [unclassified Pseudomonas]